MPRKQFKHPIWNELYDIILSHDNLSRAQVMYFVKLRDQFQKQRKAGDQISHAADGEKKMVESFAAFSKECEKEIEYLFAQIAKQDPVSVWATSILGVGAVYACSLRAYIDMENTRYCGRIWRFAGLDPTLPKPKKAKKGEKGEKLRYCKRLKSICFLIGESFKKLSNNPRSFYGAIYKKRKLYEIDRNEAGGNKSAAVKKLAECNIGKSTDAYACYSKGTLPPAHLDMRAVRYTAKLFLAHWFTVAYREHNNGAEPPMPYVIAHTEHSRLITVDDVLEYEKAPVLEAVG